MRAFVPITNFLLYIYLIYILFMYILIYLIYLLIALIKKKSLLTLTLKTTALQLLTIDNQSKCSGLIAAD